MRILKTSVLLLLVPLLMAGCSCQSRMRHLQKRCPECFEADTLHVVDTFFVPAVSFVERLPIPPDDGLTPQVQVVDSADHRLTLLWTTDSVFVQVELPPDTIYQDVPVPVVHPSAPCPDQKAASWLPWVILVALGVGYYVGRKMGRK